VIWRNDDGNIITFFNPPTAQVAAVLPAARDVSGEVMLDTIGTPGEVRFMIGPGFQLPYTSADGYGRVIGASVYGTEKNLALNAIMIEYVEADEWGRPP
jgi:hypothetical protein